MTRRMRAVAGRRALLAGALALLGAVGCSPSSRKDDMQGRGDAIPTSSPDIIGTVTATDGERIRVEENPLDRSGSAKASVRLVRGETRILRRSGAGANAEDIRQGSRVAVWFVGPVMESYPVQAKGGVVVIED
jgi:hypothetical protein